MRCRKSAIFAAASALLAGTAFAVGLHAAAAPAGASSAAEGLAAWDQIRSVLQHPRCLNCHQADVPLQGDEGRLHVPLVHRGADNLGVPGMRCTNCHNKSGNNETSQTPGAPPWSLAPRSMLWQDLGSGDLCRMLKDPARNGKRSPDMLLEHMESEPLVLWAWKPGGSRSVPPLDHEAFVDRMKTWIAAGTPCPR